MLYTFVAVIQYELVSSRPMVQQSINAKTILDQRKSIKSSMRHNLTVLQSINKVNLRLNNWLSIILSCSNFAVGRGSRTIAYIFLFSPWLCTWQCHPPSLCQPCIPFANILQHIFGFLNHNLSKILFVLKTNQYRKIL